MDNNHIFVSYSKKNRDYARSFADYLLTSGFNVWIDDRIDYGQNWERAIFKAIDECAAFIVIMTPESYESDWVQRECAHADARGKSQFPVLLDGEVFPRYRLTQYVEVQSDSMPPDGFLETLANSAPRGEQEGQEVTISFPQNPSLPQHQEVEQHIPAIRILNQLWPYISVKTFRQIDAQLNYAYLEVDLASKTIYRYDATRLQYPAKYKLVTKPIVETSLQKFDRQLKKFINSIGNTTSFENIAGVERFFPIYKRVYDSSERRDEQSRKYEAVLSLFWGALDKAHSQLIQTIQKELPTFEFPEDLPE